MASQPPFDRSSAHQQLNLTDETTLLQVAHLQRDRSAHIYDRQVGPNPIEALLARVRNTAIPNPLLVATDLLTKLLRRVR